MTRSKKSLSLILQRNFLHILNSTLKNSNYHNPFYCVKNTH